MALREVILFIGNGSLDQPARNYLIYNKIRFREVDATKKEGFAELIKCTRQKNTPALYVRRSSGVGTCIGFGDFQFATALNPMLSYDEFVRIGRKVFKTEK